MENEVITIAPDIDTSPPAMLAIAIAQGASVADLSGLMDIQERWEANEAKKAFTKAMAAFKKKVPALPRTETVSYGNTEFKFCPLDKVCEVLDPALAKHGLSFRWVQEQTGEMLKVTCILTHVQGHSESTCLTAAADTSGKKNPIQAIASTNTYLQRYTLRAITGTSEAGDDDGAGVATAETISEEQCLTLEALISDNDLPSDVFHEWLLVAKGAKYIDQIPVNEYRSVVRKINSSIEARRESK